LHGAAITWIFYDGSRHFHFGILCARWLRTLINRLDPLLFGSCFESWIKELWPGRHDLIAIDGKTSRRTYDKRKGLKALHTLSAYATNARLVLGQLSVPEKTNEITAIPELLDHLAEAKQLEGALVTIDAMGCQVATADKIVEHKADYLLALKGNQPRSKRSPITSTPLQQKDSSSRTRKIERGYTASSNVHWIISTRSYPGEPRFTNIKIHVRVFSRVELCRSLHVRDALLYLVGSSH
jgi:hypothetical protein